MTAVYLAFAWLMGIIVGRATALTWWPWLIAALVLTAAAFLLRRSVDYTQPGFRWGMAIACGAAFAFGALRLSIVTPPDLAAYNDQGRMTISGTIVDMPDQRDSHVNLRVHVDSALLPTGEQREIEGVVLVQAPRYDAYQHGDRIQAQGQLRTPPDLPDFSYRDYLAREGVYSMMSFGWVDVIEERESHTFRSRLSSFRAEANAVIIERLPDPAASLLAGILLGIETGISPEVRQAFNAVGATHVIAISGSNLVILAGIVDRSVGRFLTRRLTGILTIGVLIGYALFVGADSAVIRAAIMVSMVIIAELLGRQAWSLASLAVAAWLMTVLNPFTVWDVGFQLSFFATLGLVFYVDPMQRGLEGLLTRLLDEEQARRVVGSLSDAVLVTIAAQITTTPIMAYHFGRISLVSLPVNLLIIPVQAAIMVLGGIGTLLAMVLVPLGQIVLWLALPFLQWTITIVRAFAAMPFASTEIAVSAASVILFYVGLFGVTLIMQQSERKRERTLNDILGLWGVKAAAVVGLLLIVVAYMGAFSLPDGRMHVVFADVGEGAATIIRTPTGRTILIDGGSSGRALATALGDALPFWERRIDLLIITQPKAHLIGGLPPVLRRYQVDAVMTNGVRGDTQVAEAVWQAFDQQGTQIVIAQEGMTVDVGDGVTIEVLYAESGGEEEHGQPVVVIATYGEARFLLSGDLTPEIEARLNPPHATVLQVPRSGHRDASTNPFLTAVSPQVAVISTNAGNRFGLPHAEALERLQAHSIDVRRTDQVGTVHMWTNGEKLWLTHR